jgi:hypothetical protein
VRCCQAPASIKRIFSGYCLKHLDENENEGKSHFCYLSRSAYTLPAR